MLEFLSMAVTVLVLSRWHTLHNDVFLSEDTLCGIPASMSELLRSVHQCQTLLLDDAIVGFRFG